MDGDTLLDATAIIGQAWKTEVACSNRDILWVDVA